MKLVPVEIMKLVPVAIRFFMVISQVGSTNAPVGKMVRKESAGNESVGKVVRKESAGKESVGKMVRKESAGKESVGKVSITTNAPASKLDKIRAFANQRRDIFKRKGKMTKAASTSESETSVGEITGIVTTRKNPASVTTRKNPASERAIENKNPASENKDPGNSKNKPKVPEGIDKQEMASGNQNRENQNRENQSRGKVPNMNSGKVLKQNSGKDKMTVPVPVPVPSQGGSNRSSQGGSNQKDKVTMLNQKDKTNTLPKTNKISTKSTLTSNTKTNSLPKTNKLKVSEEDLERLYSNLQKAKEDSRLLLEELKNNEEEITDCQKVMEILMRGITKEEWEDEESDEMEGECAGMEGECDEESERERSEKEKEREIEKQTKSLKQTKSSVTKSGTNSIKQTKSGTKSNLPPLTQKINFYEEFLDYVHSFMFSLEDISESIRLLNVTIVDSLEIISLYFSFFWWQPLDKDSQWVEYLRREAECEGRRGVECEDRKGVYEKSDCEKNECEIKSDFEKSYCEKGVYGTIRKARKVESEKSGKEKAESEKSGKEKEIEKQTKSFKQTNSLSENKQSKLESLYKEVQSTVLEIKKTILVSFKEELLKLLGSNKISNIKKNYVIIKNKLSEMKRFKKESDHINDSIDHVNRNIDHSNIDHSNIDHMNGNPRNLVAASNNDQNGNPISAPFLPSLPFSFTLPASSPIDHSVDVLLVKIKGFYRLYSKRIKENLIFYLDCKKYLEEYESVVDKVKMFTSNNEAIAYGGGCCSSAKDKEVYCSKYDSSHNCVSSAKDKEVYFPSAKEVYFPSASANGSSHFHCNNFHCNQNTPANTQNTPALERARNKLSNLKGLVGELGIKKVDEEFRPNSIKVGFKALIELIGNSKEYSEKGEVMERKGK